MSSVSMVLVGKERFLKKDKSGYWYKVNYISEYSSEKQEAGCVGSQCGDKFVEEDCWYGIKPEDIGREFVFEFAMNQYGNPVVSGLRFAETKTK